MAFTQCLIMIVIIMHELRKCLLFVQHYMQPCRGCTRLYVERFTAVKYTGETKKLF